MSEIKCLKAKEIVDPDHLKKFKPTELRKVIDVFNTRWFAEPVSSTNKTSMAKAIGELARGDIEFRNNHFKENPEADFATLDDLITANTNHNDGLPEELTDNEYDEQCKDVPMVTPAEVEDGEKNGLTDEILDIIKRLTGVDYLDIYGFCPEEKEEIIEEEPEKEEVVEEPEIEKEEAVQEEIEKEEIIEEPDIKKEEPKTKKAKPGEMGVHTADLCEALEFVSPGLGKEENEQLLRFEKDHIRTYSSNISITHPFESGITGSVTGKELVALAKKLPEQGLNISQSEDIMFIRGEESDIQFNFSTLMMPSVEIPGKEEKWIKLPKDFSSMIAIAALSCSTKARNPVYNCVVVEKNSVVACENGVRGIEVLMESEFNGKMNIPGKLAKELSKYNPNEVCIQGDSWFHFKNPYGTTISLRQYATGEFTKLFYDNLEHKGIAVEIPAKTKKTVERSSILAGKGFRDYVSVNISKQKMVIKGKSETGCLTETIELKNNEVEAEFSIHPILFKEVLSIASMMEICENYIIFKGDGVICWISKIVPNN